MSAITEAEAKTRWCPFARVSFKGTGAPCNRVYQEANAQVTSEPVKMAQCIGSACMAWRELHPSHEREDHSGAASFMADIAITTGRRVRRKGPSGCLGRLILDATGYCGLAGKP